jgi:hypothetical protein
MTDIDPPAGWYPDPGTPGGERYWDGAAWSEATRLPQPMVPQPGLPPRKSSGTWWKVLLGLFLLFVLGVGGCIALFVTAADEIIEAAGELERIETQGEDIVEETAVITACALGELGLATATVVFTSPFDEEKGFISVEVSFYDDDDVVVGSGAVVFENLSPGETGRGDAVSPVADGTTSVRCAVTDGTVW